MHSVDLISAPKSYQKEWNIIRPLRLSQIRIEAGKIVVLLNVETKLNGTSFQQDASASFQLYYTCIAKC